MNLKSLSEWATDNSGQEIFEILLKSDFFVPDKFDSREPERYVFNEENQSRFLEFWKSEIKFLILKKIKPHISWIMIRMWPKNMNRFNEMSASFDSRYLSEKNGINNLVSFAKKLYLWGRVDHGYICHEEDWNNKNYFGSFTKITKDRYSFTGGISLIENLPGIYWVNFFGPAYVDFFGEVKFKEIQTFSKEKMKNGGYLLIISETPNEFKSKNIIEEQNKIVEFLNKKAFFEKSKPQKKCCAPDFVR